MSFGDNVRWLRKRQGMLQSELAQHVRINRKKPTPSYISRLERDLLDPKLSTVRSIAKALHVKTWYLLADITENSEFWDLYLSLSPAKKRQIQRVMQSYIERDAYMDDL